MWPFPRRSSNSDLTTTTLRLISKGLAYIQTDVRQGFSDLNARFDAMTVSQDKFNQTMSDLKTAVEADMAAHATDIQAAVDKAKAAWDADDQGAFDAATQTATDLINEIKSKAGTSVSDNAPAGPDLAAPGPNVSIPPQSPVGISTSGPETAAIPDPSLVNVTPGSQDSMDAATALANPQLDPSVVPGTAPVVATTQPAPPAAAPVVPAATTPLEPSDPAPDAPAPVTPATTQAPPLDPNASQTP